MLDTIVKGTRRILEFATHCQAKRFLMISSGAVYGKQRIRLNHIPEDYECGPDPLNPLSAYAEGKRMAELLCAIYAHEKGIGINIARCFAFIGPYLPLDLHFAIGNFIQDGLNGGPILVRGDGTPYRSYLYASDLVIWLLKLLQRAEGCAAFNVGSEHGLSIAELAQIVAECFHPPVQVNILGCSDSNKISDRYVPSTQKIRSEIKVEETVDLRTGILKTIDWHKQMKSM
jgi:dTDP-glucose 4,6-dehydratase